jgi:heat shock protein HslJ
LDAGKIGWAVIHEPELLSGPQMNVNKRKSRMKRISMIQPLIFSAILLVGATAQAGAPVAEPTAETAPTAIDYLGRYRWNLIQLDGQPTGDIRPTLELRGSASGSIAGFNGCNRYFGSYRIDGATLALTMTGTTRMACEGEGDRLERRLAGLLDGTPRPFDIADQALNLYGETGILLMFGRGEPLPE